MVSSAAAAIAALALSGPAFAAGQQGMTVVKDAATGQLRAPTADEAAQLQALADQQRAAASNRKSTARSATTTAATVAPGARIYHEDGSVEMTVDPEQVSYSVMTKDADGKLVLHCVTGATFRDFGGAPRPATWYSYALGNKLRGAYLGTLNAPQINANFNSNLGLDANHGANIDLVAVLLHEIGHGVRFQTFTSGLSGNFNGGFPSVWDHNLLDNTTGKTWTIMTVAGRAASAIKPNGLSWTGTLVTAAAPGVLSAAGSVNVSGVNAGAAAGNYNYGDASFGPPLKNPAVVGQVMPVVDQADGSGLACGALSATNALAVKNNIALVSRGVCGFAIKAKFVQVAAAIGMIVADNARARQPA